MGVNLAFLVCGDKIFLYNIKRKENPQSHCIVKWQQTDGNTKDGRRAEQGGTMAEKEQFYEQTPAEPDKKDKAYERLHQFMGMVYSACKMSIWCYSRYGKLYYTSSSNEKELERFLKESGCLAYALSEKRDRKKLIYLSDSLGMMWTADYLMTGESKGLVILLGPVFSSESSWKGIEGSLRKMEYSIQERNRLLQELSKLPILSQQMIDQYASMLHYALTGEMQLTSVSEFQHSAVESREHDGRQMEQEKQTEYGEETADEKKQKGRSRMLEARILKAVKEGEIEFGLDRVMGENGVEYKSLIKIDYGGKEALRDEKDTVLIFTALCARAAIEGGLSEVIAMELEKEYVRKVEQTRTVTELILLNQVMLHSFIEKVYDCRIQSGISRPIQECCNYINRNLCNNLKLKEMAEEIGYTEYYLTRKFAKEMGIPMSEYINTKKTELAKIWLLTTDKSMQEISDELGYGTRNYFSRVFKEKTGISPAACRAGAEMPKLG